MMLITVTGDVWCFMGLKYLENISSIRIMNNSNDDNQQYWLMKAAEQMYSNNAEWIIRNQRGQYTMNAKYTNKHTTSKKLSLKGTVTRDFWPLFFFMNRPHMGP